MAVRCLTIPGEDTLALRLPMDTPRHQSPIAVTLEDGSIAHLRPITPADAPLLTEGLDRMSVESRFARFGVGVGRLGRQELRYLTELDHRLHVAWGALVDDRPAGVARMIRTEPDTAEVAVAVVDDLQGRGLGRALFTALVASARDLGVEVFIFTVLPSSRAALAAVAGMGASLDRRGSVVHGRVELSGLPRGERDAEFAGLLSTYREAGRSTPPRRPSAPGPAPPS